MSPAPPPQTGAQATSTDRGVEASEPRFAHSFAQHARARRTLAGGVATAIRAGQLPVPITFERGAGARLWDIDGNEYVDYTLAYGPMLLGHSPRTVVDAVRKQIDTGIGYGASHRFEAELAEAVCRTVPSAELCVFGSTGSEAVHSALRIARAATGRVRVVKCVGHYHGWFDTINVERSEPGDVLPATQGQDPAAAAAVTICEWNDLDALGAALGDSIHCPAGGGAVRRALRPPGLQRPVRRPAVLPGLSRTPGSYAREPYAVVACGALASARRRRRRGATATGRSSSSR